MYNKRFDDPLSSLSTVYLWHDIIIDKIFFMNYLNRSCHGDPDKKFISALRLGPSDIRPFTGTSLYEKTGTGAYVPNHFSDRTVFNKTENNELWFYSKSKLRLIPHISIAIGLGILPENIIQINNKDSYIFSYIELDIIPIPDFFNRTESWYMRKNDDDNIYLVKKFKRTLLSPADSMKIMEDSSIDITVVDGFDIKLLELSNESM
jgi:hypothetical protein